MHKWLLYSKLHTVEHKLAPFAHQHNITSKVTRIGQRSQMPSWAKDKLLCRKYGQLASLERAQGLD